MSISCSYHAFDYFLYHFKAKIFPEFRFAGHLALKGFPEALNQKKNTKTAALRPLSYFRVNGLMGVHPNDLGGRPKT